MTTILQNRKPVKNSVFIKVESDKKLLHVTIAAAIFLLSFTAQKFTATKATAEVNQYQGLYIFTDSKPVSEYNYLGTVQCKIMQGIIHPGYNGLCTAEPTYEQLKEDLIKQAKKKFKDADAIIINYNESKADAIQFK